MPMESNSAPAGKSIDWRVPVSLGCGHLDPLPLCVSSRTCHLGRNQTFQERWLWPCCYCSTAVRMWQGLPIFWLELASFPCLYLSRPWYRQERWESHSKGLQIASGLWRELVYASLWTTWGFPGGSDIKNLSAVQKTWVQSLGQEDPLEKGVATHSSNSCLENPMDSGTWGLQSMGSSPLGWYQWRVESKFSESEPGIGFRPYTAM